MRYLCLVRSVVVFGVLYVPIAGSSVLAQGLTASQIMELPVEDQIDYVAAAFEERLRRCENIEYRYEHHCCTQRRLDGRWEEVIWPGVVSEYERFRIGESYRLVSTKFGEDLEKTGSPDRIQSGFDSRIGVGRSRVAKRGGGFYGRIDTTHDEVVVNDRLSYWLTGPGVPDGEFLFPYFLSQKSEWTLNADGDGLIKLEAPWKKWPNRDLAVGKRTMWLDPAKDLMPIRGEGRWDKSTPERESWRTNSFAVEESRQFDGCWMPVKLKEWIGSSSARNAYPDDYRNLYQVDDIVVSDVQFNTVEPGDLVVEFPEGTEVVDALKAESYVVGSGGQAVNVEPVFVGNRFADGSVPPKPRATQWFLWVNLALVLIVAVSAGYYTKRKRGGSR